MLIPQRPQTLLISSILPYISSLASGSLGWGLTRLGEVRRPYSNATVMVVSRSIFEEKQVREFRVPTSEGRTLPLDRDDGSYPYIYKGGVVVWNTLYYFYRVDPSTSTSIGALRFASLPPWRV
jgi:hypothetical protein